MENKNQLYLHIEGFFDDLFDLDIPENYLDLIFDKWSNARRDIFCVDGHSYIYDQCGREDHQYCFYCGEQIKL